ncbi:MAG: VCBS repeat-containing protein [candidate division KSB1 bacterium]|nr:VCBS repeat-containing protein [candidate division KSB1 bacterium]
MFKQKLHIIVVFLIQGVLQLLFSQGEAVNSEFVESVTPRPYTIGVNENTAIIIHTTLDVDSIDRPEDMLKLYGQRSGRISGNVQYNSDSAQFIFTPQSPFLFSDEITGVLSLNALNIDRSPDFFIWSFTIRTAASHPYYHNLSYDSNLNLTSLATLDIQDDGVDEIIIAGSRNNQHYIQLLNNNYGQIKAGPLFGVPDRVRPIITGDLNADGISDLLLLHRGKSLYDIPPRFSVVTVSSQGNFTLEQTVTVAGLKAGTAEPRDAFLKDLNGDGALDIALLMRTGTSKSIYVYLNNGSGAFDQSGPSHLFYSQPQGESMLGNDFNLDGTVDLAVSHHSGSRSGISIFCNSGRDSLYQNEPDYTIEHGNYDFESSLCHDFNNDHLPDLLWGDFTNVDFFLYEHQGVDTGLTPFKPEFRLSRFNNSIGGTLSLISSDFDADDDMDIGWIGYSVGQFSILWNDNGFNTASTNYRILENPVRAASGYFDQNDGMDFCIADASGTMTFLFNRPDERHAPDSPRLIAPLSNSVHQDTLSRFAWEIPDDADGDSLSFIVNIFDENGTLLQYDAAKKPQLFDPVPPVAAASGDMRFQLPVSLRDAVYEWEVIAQDSLMISEPSPRRAFSIDSQAPIITELIWQNPDYADKWYAADTETEISFQVDLQEEHPDSVVLTGDEVGRFAYIFDDTLHTGPFSFWPEVQTDGLYSVRCDVIDKAGQRSFIADTLGLDFTPPSGAACDIKSDTSRTDTFRVFWGGGKDGNGSGIHSYRIRYKQNDGKWTVWIYNTEKTDSLFTGENKSTYYFEAVGSDHVGYQQPYAGEQDAVTVSIPGDTLPPGQPVNLLVDDGKVSNWQAQPEFQIGWENPPDESGIARTLYKLETSPLDDWDTTGTLPQTQRVDISANRENGQYVYIWLQDSSGNADFNSRDSVLLRYDATEPVIQAVKLLLAGRDTSALWFNPDSNSTAVLRMFYDELNPVQLRCEFSEFLDPITRTPAVTDSIDFSIDLQTIPDTRLTATLSCIDKAGNRSEQPFFIGLDSTPPQNTMALAPDTTSLQNIPISIDTINTIENTSGLSGVYRIWVKTDDGEWSIARSRYTDSKYNHAAQFGHMYYFAAGAIDNAGNVELFKGQAECSTYVNENYVDDQPPGKPLNTKVNGHGLFQWFADREIKVSWETPPDESGISHYYLKWNSPPADSSDYDEKEPAVSPFTATIPDTGKNILYLWLEDSSGNTDSEQYADIRLGYDPTDPQVDSLRLVNAVFLEKWLNPDSNTAAHYRLTVREAHLDSIQWSIEGTDAASAFMDTLASMNAQYNLQIPVLDLAQGCHRIAFTVTDSAGNSTTVQHECCIDSEAPQATIAQSPDTSLSKAFSVTWQGAPGVDQENGSGLSGQYDLRMRVNAGEWRTIISRLGIKSFSFSGDHGKTYEFEAAAWDNTGNRELFSGIAETSTHIDTNFQDSTPPDAPLSVKINGQDPTVWFSDTSLTLSWKNPDDLSGISAVYYKYGTAPETAEDYSGMQRINGDSSIILNTIPENGVRCFLWLEDGVGNTDHTRYTEIYIKNDNTVSGYHNSLSD